jgi:hypothetical protein
MKITFSILVFVSLFCATINCASASYITIQLTGVVEEIQFDPSNLIQGKINVGDFVSGFYTYDSTTPNTYVDPTDSTVASYWNYSSPSGITLNIDGFVFATDPNNVAFNISIENNHINQDYYSVMSDINLPLFDGTPVGYISWLLHDYTGTALSGINLPTDAPNLSDWPSISYLGIHYDDMSYHDPLEDRSYSVAINVTSVQLAPVPEPATMLLMLFGSGVMGAGIKRLRRKFQK